MNATLIFKQSDVLNTSLNTSITIYDDIEYLKQSLNTLRPVQILYNF